MTDLLAGTETRDGAESKLRDYQAEALRRVEADHEEVRGVCLVSPTGSGKSVMGREWVRRHVSQGRRVLVLAHRLELLEQFAGHMRQIGIGAGIIASSEPLRPHEPVQCASLDTLIARGEVPQSDAIVWDECHHAAADTWRVVPDALPGAPLLGLTATPQRSDGRAIGDIFDRLVTAASYSQLIAAGHLVPCRVFRPERHLGSDLAWDPVDAYADHAAGRQAFFFARSIKAAKELAARLTAAGYPAACIDGKMPSDKRRSIIEQFRRRQLVALTNMHILTEGIDVPAAEVCVLARGAGHAGTYLQMVGRVLRTSPGKRHAMLIDLPGCSHDTAHGLPTSDREYSLSGKAIRTVGEPLKNCLKCGMTVASLVRQCPECGYEWPRREWKGPKIWNLELLEYIETTGEGSTESVPKSMRAAEFERLRKVARSKGYGISWAASEYRKIFGDSPDTSDVPDDVRVDELARLLRVQQLRGLKLGWISHAYKGTFGSFPSRELRQQAGVPLPEPGQWRPRGTLPRFGRGR